MSLLGSQMPFPLPSKPLGPCQLPGSSLTNDLCSAHISSQSLSFFQGEMNTVFSIASSFDKNAAVVCTIQRLVLCHLERPSRQSKNPKMHFRHRSICGSRAAFLSHLPCSLVLIKRLEMKLEGQMVRGTSVSTTGPDPVWYRVYRRQMSPLETHLKRMSFQSSIYLYRIKASG